MINDWRQRWNQGDFPSILYNSPASIQPMAVHKNGSTWAELSEAQTNTLSLPNTGMAVTIDIGESKTFTPATNRMWASALPLSPCTTYTKRMANTADRCTSAMKAAGNKIELSFSHATNRVLWRNDKYGYIKGFEIAGADQKFYFAQAAGKRR